MRDDLGTAQATRFRILVTGGGTGGHVSPVLSVHETLKKLSTNDEAEPVFLYLGSRTGVERELAGKAALPFIGVHTGKLRRSFTIRGYFTWKNFVDVFRIPIGICESLVHVWRFRPDVVFATGGYVSVPPVVAAWLLNIPILAHEQTTQIGLANRIVSRFAARIALSFEESIDGLPERLRSKVIVTGNPVREAVFVGNRTSAIERFGFSTDDDVLPTIYITGGVQGASTINRLIESMLPDLLGLCRVVHQCGEQPKGREQDYDRLVAVSSRLCEQLRRRYFLARFINAEEIGNVFVLADIIVGRSGAGTISEIAALGKPAILIPLVPTGGDEQMRNAVRFERAGAARVIKKEDLTGKRLFSEVETLVTDVGLVKQMGAAARSLAHPEAATMIAMALIGLAQAKKFGGR